MSRHITYNKTHEIALGIDRPLNHVFASVFDQDTQEASEGFDPFSWFEPSEAGIDQAIQAVEEFTKHKLPDTMRVALIEDLISMQNGNSVNRVETHGVVNNHAFAT